MTSPPPPMTSTESLAIFSCLVYTAFLRCFVAWLIHEVQIVHFVDCWPYFGDFLHDVAMKSIQPGWILRFSCRRGKTCCHKMPLPARIGRPHEVCMIIFALFIESEVYRSYMHKDGHRSAFSHSLFQTLISDLFTTLESLEGSEGLIAVWSAENFTLYKMHDYFKPY